jgi:hypothetical protein
LLLALAMGSVGDPDPDLTETSGSSPFSQNKGKDKDHPRGILILKDVRCCDTSNPLSLRLPSHSPPNAETEASSYVRRPRPHNFRITPAIQSTKTNLRKFLRSARDLATRLVEARIEVGVSGRSGGAGEKALRLVSCDALLLPSTALLVAPSVAGGLARPVRVEVPAAGGAWTADHCPGRTRSPYPSASLTAW